MTAEVITELGDGFSPVSPIRPAAEGDAIPEGFVPVEDGSNVISLSRPAPKPQMELPEDLKALLPSIVEAIREEVRGEFVNYLHDAEWRLEQAAEMERRARGHDPSMVYAEDINSLEFQLTGWAYTNNSPAAGSVAWTAVHIVHGGVDYTVADGNTAMKYITFVKPGSGTTATFTLSNTKPVLGVNDTLVFYNNNGTLVNMLNPGTLHPAVMDGAIGTAEIQNGAVTAGKTDFATALTAAVTQAQTDATNALATADGSIASYFQEAAPWANGDATAGGAANPSARTGDLWYRPSDGQAFRWTGPAPGGSIPVNNWFAIEDSSINAALSAANAAQTTANAKITIWYANAAAPPAATAVGDLWVVLDQGNKNRRATALGTGGWVDILVGTSAIATGAITDALVATGISGGKLTAGTVTNTQLGTGIDGAKLTDGTIAGAKIGAGQITPVKINSLTHQIF